MEASLFTDESPTCPVRWPFLDTYDFTRVVPTDAEIHDVLKTDWGAMLEQTKLDSGGLLKRIPAELDQVLNRHRTVHWELPIMCDCGTTSYVDARRRQKFVQDHVDSVRVLY